MTSPAQSLKVASEVKTMKETVVLDGVKIMLMSSISEIAPEDEGMIIIAGSHAGRNVAEYALRYPLRAAFFNDAGRGKADAGIVSLQTFEERGLPAGTVAHTSACIGDAADSFAYGVLSHLNLPARKAGLLVGEPLRTALVRCFGGVG
jgi:hypothetical protein